MSETDTELYNCSYQLLSTGTAPENYTIILAAFPLLVSESNLPPLKLVKKILFMSCVHAQVTN